MWAKTYVQQGGVAGLAVEPDGSFFIIGADADLGPPLGEWIAKCDSSGNLLFQATYDPVPEFFKAHLAADGNVVVMAAYSNDLMKIDSATGAIVWAWAYAYSIPPGDFGLWDSADFQVAQDGGYVMVGYNYKGGAQNTVVLRTDPDGIVRWARRYEGGKHAQFVPHIALAPEGGYYLLQDAGDQDQRVARLDADGAILWQKHLIWPTRPGASYSTAPAFAAMPDGGCLIEGYVAGLDPQNPQIFYGWLAALTPAGDVAWSETGVVGGGPGAILASSDGITLSEDGGVLVRLDSEGLPPPECTSLPPTPGLIAVEDTQYSSQDVSGEITTAPVIAWAYGTSAVATPVTNITDTVLCGDSFPGIISVQKLQSPFRLKVTGRNFEDGSTLLINGTAAKKTTYKGADSKGRTRVVAKGGGLKAMLPKGEPVTLTVLNPDGRESVAFTFTR